MLLSTSAFKFKLRRYSVVPHTLVLQVWAGNLLEGVIDITKTGIISRATFGILVLFGYHEVGRCRLTLPNPS
jgi:hypothetical protein